MEVRIHDSADEFRAIAEPVYRRDPIANTIELTVLAAAMPDDALLLSVWRDSEVVGVALQTPPYPLACNGIPIGCAGIVARDLRRRRPDLIGVRGSREVAVAIADAWRSHGECAGSVTLEERLYRLGTLRPPAGVAGVPRWADETHRAVLIDWVEHFSAETFGHPRDDTAGARFVDAAADRADRFLLWDVDGTAVSTALLRAPAAGVSRIGPVFTPADRRTNGYGSAVTAAAAQASLDRGDVAVVLFTDRANPTSNAIYRKIGFEPVSEFARIDFRTVDQP
ncbi:acetyltransferase [Mycobacterium sp. GA-1199]|uniref:GNAT family N-acetyltransferase n=1 Tax=Mycobacterium sp. GA-1199 TaxID=1772287 RepID=UPI000748E4D6|nr:GNAT family N-acetyltransferase [Mycobacterium sp. GA-1199]KUI47763.1 acetyltransferase [Mycobacterium sp. GA-1199]